MITKIMTFFKQRRIAEFDARIERLSEQGKAHTARKLALMQELYALVCEHSPEIAEQCPNFETFAVLEAQNALNELIDLYRTQRGE